MVTFTRSPDLVHLPYLGFIIPSYWTTGVPPAPHFCNVVMNILCVFTEGESCVVVRLLAPRRWIHVILLSTSRVCCREQYWFTSVYTSLCQPIQVYSSLFQAPCYAHGLMWPEFCQHFGSSQTSGVSKVSPGKHSEGGQSTQRICSLNLDKHDSYNHSYLKLLWGINKYNHLLMTSYAPDTLHHDLIYFPKTWIFLLSFYKYGKWGSALLGTCHIWILICLISSTGSLKWSPCIDCSPVAWSNVLSFQIFQIHRLPLSPLRPSAPFRRNRKIMSLWILSLLPQWYLTQPRFRQPTWLTSLTRPRCWSQNTNLQPRSHQKMEKLRLECHPSSYLQGTLEFANKVLILILPLVVWAQQETSHFWALVSSYVKWGHWYPLHSIAVESDVSVNGIKVLVKCDIIFNGTEILLYSLAWKNDFLI